MTPRSRLRSAMPLLLAGVALALVLGTPAAARPKQGGGPVSFTARYAAELGLDEADQARLQEIVAASRLREAAIRERLHAARAAMRTLLDGTADPEEAAVMAQVDRIEAIEAERHKNRLRAIIEIGRLLTSEQRAELARLRQERFGEEGPRERRGRGRRDRHACQVDWSRLCEPDDVGPAGLRCLANRWDALSDTCRERMTFPRRPRGEGDRGTAAGEDVAER